MKNNPPLLKLKTIREKRGLTVREISKILNISKSMYSYIENGKKRLTYDMAVSIGDILGICPNDLFLEDFKDFFKINYI